MKLNNGTRGIAASALVLWVCISGCGSAGHADAPAPISIAAPDSPATTIFIVRHANKERKPANPEDPGLSDVGQDRAKRLAEALRDAGIDMIYHSDAIRARQTAGLVLAALKPGGTLPQRVYGYDATNAKVPELAQRLIDEGPGHVILVVAHSHSMPALLERLGGWKVAPILTDEDRDFDNVFVVTLHKDGAKRLARLGYPPAAR